MSAKRCKGALYGEEGAEVGAALGVPERPAAQTGKWGCTWGAAKGLAELPPGGLHPERGGPHALLAPTGVNPALSLETLGNLKKI